MTLDLFPNAGAPGTSVLAVGLGFSGSGRLTVADALAAEFAVDENGGFAVSFPVPHGPEIDLSVQAITDAEHESTVLTIAGLKTAHRAKAR